jgi:hypothetical protein
MFPAKSFEPGGIILIKTKKVIGPGKSKNRWPGEISGKV